MKDSFIFAIAVCFAVIPIGSIVLRLFYKRTIVFKISIVMFINAMLTAIVAHLLSSLSALSLIWAIPLIASFMLISNMLVIKWVQRPITKVKDRIEEMSLGKFAVQSMRKNKHKQDEVGDIFRAANKLSRNLHETALFADAIAKNDFDKEYTLLSDDDELGKSLINMRDELKAAKTTEETRAKEQGKDAWSANGIAEFSELLRQETSDLEILSRTFISKLTDYTGAIQGGVFIINNDEEEHIKYELKGAVAFNRVKHMEKEFEIGIGLVGQCAYEKAPIFLNNTPDDYMEITSGLGEANPRFALLIPAIMNDTVYAVIELASFSKIEQYKIDFIAKISEALASTISMVKINASTAKLLHESKEKADMLEEQSEILKQNIEELTATQEELARKDAELERITHELEERGITL